MFFHNLLYLLQEVQLPLSGICFRCRRCTAFDSSDKLSSFISKYHGDSLLWIANLQINTLFTVMLLKSQYFRTICGWDGKESVCNAGDLGSAPGSGGFPWRREWLPTPVFLPGEFRGQRNLVVYSPWGQKESDMTLNFTSVIQHTLKYSFLKFDW